MKSCHFAILLAVLVYLGMSEVRAEPAGPATWVYLVPLGEDVDTANSFLLRLCEMISSDSISGHPNLQHTVLVQRPDPKLRHLLQEGLSANMAGTNTGDDLLALYQASFKVPCRLKSLREPQPGSRSVFLTLRARSTSETSVLEVGRVTIPQKGKISDAEIRIPVERRFSLSDAGRTEAARFLAFDFLELRGRSHLSASVKGSVSAQNSCSLSEPSGRCVHLGGQIMLALTVRISPWLTMKDIRASLHEQCRDSLNRVHRREQVVALRRRGENIVGAKLSNRPRFIGRCSYTFMVRSVNAANLLTQEEYFTVRAAPSIIEPAFLGDNILWLFTLGGDHFATRPRGQSWSIYEHNRIPFLQEGNSTAYANADLNNWKYVEGAEMLREGRALRHAIEKIPLPAVGRELEGELRKALRTKMDEFGDSLIYDVLPVGLTRALGVWVPRDEQLGSPEICDELRMAMNEQLRKNDASASLVSFERSCTAEVHSAWRRLASRSRRPDRYLVSKDKRLGLGYRMVPAIEGRDWAVVPASSLLGRELLLKSREIYSLRPVGVGGDIGVPVELEMTADGARARDWGIEMWLESMSHDSQMFLRGGADLKLFFVNEGVFAGLRNGWEIGLREGELDAVFGLRWGLNLSCLLDCQSVTARLGGGYEFIQREFYVEEAVGPVLGSRGFFRPELWLRIHYPAFNLENTKGSWGTRLVAFF